MENRNPNYSGNSYSDHQPDADMKIEQDLWDALLRADGVQCDWDPNLPLTEDKIAIAEDPAARIAYPWVLSDESEAFFRQAERESVLQGMPVEEISSRSNTFFTKLDASWATIALQSALMDRFAVRMPQALLGAIAKRAGQAMSSSAALRDQLVQSVQDVTATLTSLVEDDLYVLGRPLAEPMRDQAEVIESALSAVRPVAWEELSEIEKARLSLAVARYALAELEQV